MGFQAVLDANVLLPAPLRDTLLRLAEADLYVPKWSERILAEVAKNLVASGRTDVERAARVTETMAAAFPEAMVSASLISSIEPAMANDPKDRHVLAAAVGVGAEVVVTKNLKDFPPTACESLGIQVVGPTTSSSIFTMSIHPPHFAPCQIKPLPSPSRR
jgi:predicted nucleic acid-binding protein